jgi:hypothetical protein
MSFDAFSNSFSRMLLIGLPPACEASVRITAPADLTKP